MLFEMTDLCLIPRVRSENIGVHLMIILHCTLVTIRPSKNTVQESLFDKSMATIAALAPEITQRDHSEHSFHLQYQSRGL